MKISKVLSILNTSRDQQVLEELSKIKYDNFTSEDSYFVKTPEEVLKTLQAVCYDLVEVERTKLSPYYRTLSFFTYSGLPITDNPTHTFLVYMKNSVYYWFEISWRVNRGIHGPFKNLESLLKCVRKQFLSFGWNDVTFVPYKKFDYSGMSINEFGEFMLKNSLPLNI